MLHPAIFLDRDGVIIENRPRYVRSWADVSIYPQALTALAQANGAPYKIVIVTNQSAVGRGLISASTAHTINQRLVAEIVEAGGRVDGVFMCPHAPADGCDCRKPKPGLLLKAAEALSLDLRRSLLIGDALSDLKTAKAARVSKAALVRTGRGEAQARLPAAAELMPFAIFDNLACAFDELL